MSVQHAVDERVFVGVHGFAVDPVRSARRKWEAHLRKQPLHDAHVKALWSIWPKHIQRKMRTCSCGAVVRPWEWPKDRSGRPLGHCGCRRKGKTWTDDDRRRYRREYKRRLRRARGAPTRDEIAARGAARKLAAQQDKERRAAAGAPGAIHDAHVKLWKSDEARHYRWRYRYDEEFKLAERLRRQLRKKAGIERIEHAVRSAIHGAHSGRAVEQLLGYSMKELKEHLERQFRHGMEWSKYGRTGWHIDHILPKRCFDLSTDAGVRAYWSLPNLRPLAARDNLKKNEAITHLI